MLEGEIVDMAAVETVSEGTAAARTAVSEIPEEVVGIPPPAQQ